MANKYSFEISFTQKNIAWCRANLDEIDYCVDNKAGVKPATIYITYYNVMQKNNILNALAKL